MTMNPRSRNGWRVHCQKDEQVIQQKTDKDREQFANLDKIFFPRKYIHLKCAMLAAERAKRYEHARDRELDQMILKGTHE